MGQALADDDGGRVREVTSLADLRQTAVDVARGLDRGEELRLHPQDPRGVVESRAPGGRWSPIAQGISELRIERHRHGATVHLRAAQGPRLLWARAVLTWGGRP